MIVFISSELIISHYYAGPNTYHASIRYEIGDDDKQALELIHPNQQLYQFYMNTFLLRPLLFFMLTLGIIS